MVVLMDCGGQDGHLVQLQLGQLCQGELEICSNPKLDLADNVYLARNLENDRSRMKNNLSELSGFSSSLKAQDSLQKSRRQVRSLQQAET